MSDNWGIDIGGLLLALGENPDREGLQGTPDRVERAWNEFLEGYTLDPKDILGTTWEAESFGVQACTNISFCSMCEHHLLPFFGEVSIAYRPYQSEALEVKEHGRVVGLSKLARLVDCFARRLQLQERMTQQIADALYKHLVPKGVLVVCKAKHLCCHGRGIRRSQMEFKTMAQCGTVSSDFWRTLQC